MPYSKLSSELQELVRNLVLNYAQSNGAIYANDVRTILESVMVLAPKPIKNVESTEPVKETNVTDSVSTDRITDLLDKIFSINKTSPTDDTKVSAHLCNPLGCVDVYLLKETEEGFFFRAVRNGVYVDLKGDTEDAFRAIPYNVFNVMFNSVGQPLE